MSALQQQVENLVERSVETSAAAKTTQAALNKQICASKTSLPAFMAWLKVRWELGLAGVVAREACQVECG